MAIKRFISIALFLALVTRSYSKLESRIVGGQDAQKNEFPYAVSLRMDNAHTCGGSIISEWHILTAAHCVTEKTNTITVDINRLSIRVGSTNIYSGGKIVKLSNIIVNPAYIDLQNDLAILTLSEALVWTDRIKSIPYAKAGSQLPATGTEVKTAGWGELLDGAIPYKLQQSRYTVASEEDCANAFKFKDESIICLAHNLKEGSCKGDAGNGAVHDSTLIAVSNYVIGSCGSRYPDVYLNVAHYSDWIDSILNEN